MKSDVVSFQIAPEGTPWPSGLGVDLAELPISEDHIRSIVGVPLVRGVEDGLGPWSAIGLMFVSGAHVEIISYDEVIGPPHFIVLADSNADFDAVLRDVLALFKIERNSLAWVSPRVRKDRI